MIGAIASPRFDRYVEHSWQRCSAEYGLDPVRWQNPQYVALGDLERRRKLAGPIYAGACAGLVSLGRLLRGPIGVTLTDPHAVILGFAGDRAFAQVARQFGLRPGAVWSESAQGTNGMGTCLAVRAPVVVEQQQHFLRQNTALTCCAVPILDGTGVLVGVLNASTLGSMSSAPTLALLEFVARDIENRALLETHGRRHFVLRFHVQREFVSTMAEGILAIDAGGTIVASNRAALGIVGTDVHRNVCDRSTMDVLGLDMPQLRRLARQSRHDPQRLRSEPYFGLVQPPLEPRAGAPNCAQVAGDRLATGNALQQAERQALLTVLECCRGNVSRAATRLQVSRRTLHRKLQHHGLRREEFM